MSSKRSRQGQSGQALVEAAVGLALLASLAMLVILLGKYQAIAWSTISASRSLAFACTVVPGGCAAGPAPVHLFGAIRDAHLGEGGESSEAATRSLWHDRRGVPMFDRFTDVSGRIAAPRFDAGQSLAGSQRLAGIPNPAELIATLAGPGRFGLDIADGIRNAQVEVAVQSGFPVGRFDESVLGTALRLRANTAVLGDTWAAAGPRGGNEAVEARVDRGRRLASPIEAGIIAGYAPARGLLLLADLLALESGTDAFRPGEIDVDLVPADRLAP